MKTLIPLALAALLMATANEAQAQAQASCRLPGVITPAPERPAPASEVSHTVANYHLLDMTWSPEWCRTRANKPADALQCQGNSFGFVLHGLWPSSSRGPHPRYCKPAPPLAARTVRDSLCMTPSVDLLQHEWAAHGTCGWSDSAAYFRQAAMLWNGLNRPPIKGSMTAGALRDAFVARNPGLPRKAIQVRVGSGNRLTEVGICYSLAFKAIACPTGGGTPDKVALRIAPKPWETRGSFLYR